MDFVVLYSLREGVDRSRVLQTYPRHKEYYEAFRAAGGGLVALGPFQTPDPGAGSMGIFTSREDAERFIAGDPFTTEGLADPRILEWNAVHFE
ncbi:YciI family protein [Arthrobacter sp. 92]|jgi:uncharacterized protein YciI|uniref:YciI family protein n=1 Tax=Arthrobacter sp. 92 TaxID=3418175 RepID=UPI0006A857FC|nr:hypothetical protein AHiyo6_36410 [Arthrobacter sp. Hiyo6]